MKYITINGDILPDKKKIENEDIFMTKFIEFVELNGWCFSGITIEKEEKKGE